MPVARVLHAGCACQARSHPTERAPRLDTSWGSRAQPLQAPAAASLLVPAHPSVCVFLALLLGRSFPPHCFHFCARTLSVSPRITPSPSVSCLACKERGVRFIRTVQTAVGICRCKCGVAAQPPCQLAWLQGFTHLFLMVALASLASVSHPSEGCGRSSTRANSGAATGAASLEHQ